MLAPAQLPFSTMFLDFRSFLQTTGSGQLSHSISQGDTFVIPNYLIKLATVIKIVYCWQNHIDIFIYNLILSLFEGFCCRLATRIIPFFVTQPPNLEIYKYIPNYINYSPESCLLHQVSIFYTFSKIFTSICLLVSTFLVSQNF